MFFRSGDEDTICAVSTPAGTGSISVLRISGPQAVLAARKLCAFLPVNLESHRIYYGHLNAAGSSEIIDEVLVAYFIAGRSFSSEETIEISCHGNPTLVSAILRELVAVGCRPAERGEFTYRAFMNGRIDLVQAESVLTLIESQSRQATKVALRQLQGHLSAEFHRIEDDLLWMLAHLEASIDFSSDGIELVPSEQILGRAVSLVEFVEKLIGSYRQGRLMKSGLEIAMIGRPNSGKSSLLNALLKEERAIVTPHPGTTRDTVEGRISVGGIPISLIDTAGLRHTEDEIEKMGIERSRSAKERADFVFRVVDAADPGAVEELTENEFLLVNKMDLDLSGEMKSRLLSVVSKEAVAGGRVFWISAATGEGLDQVRSLLESLARSLDLESSSVVMQARHHERLQKIHSCLLAALGLIKDDSSPEFIAFELNEAVRAIHELLGKEFNEQVIDRIFKEFCLGK